MKLSRTVKYAVRATLMLAKQASPRPVPCSQLAREGELPERFLLQILRNLVNHGFLKSTRGVDGGYTLIRRPQDITLLEIIEAVEGPMDCIDPEDPSESPPGLDRETYKRFHAALGEVSQTLRQELASIKLSQLLPPPK